MPPDFPIRIIFDDGEVLELESPDDLLERIDTLDSTDPANGLWVRDRSDRTVRLRMRGGIVELLEV